MFDIFDIYLLEALINGILLGGVLALLALGLNLIFGVIDVVWICYAELVMLGMYGMYYLFSVYHVPYPVAAVICIAGVGVLGVVLHLLVIEPVLGKAPINQLLATGGVLFFLQSAGHRDVRHRLPQSRHPPAGAGSRRHVSSATRGCWRSAPRWSAWWRCICSSAAPMSAPRSAPSRRTARSCR